MVEQKPEELRVGGSIPSPGTNNKKIHNVIYLMCYIFFIFFDFHSDRVVFSYLVNSLSNGIERFSDLFLSFSSIKEFKLILFKVASLES